MKKAIITLIILSLIAFLFILFDGKTIIKDILTFFI